TGPLDFWFASPHVGDGCLGNRAARDRGMSHAALEALDNASFGFPPVSPIAGGARGPNFAQFPPGGFLPRRDGPERRGRSGDGTFRPARSLQAGIDPIIWPWATSTGMACPT